MVAVPVLRTTICWAELVVPTVCAEKVSEPGILRTLTTFCPTPARAIEIGLPTASLLICRVAVSTAAVEGVNTTEMPQLALIGSLVLQPLL